jgi:tetratricopeptide (TPR) repeat protein
MSKATIKRFLMLLSSARESQRQQLYQLLEKAEYCYCLKDAKGQYEFGKALSLFSFPFNVVGDYYQSLYLHKTGQKHAAYEKLERVRQELKGSYTDKATLMLSGIKEIDRDIDESLKLRLDLAKSESLSVVVESALGRAAILGSQGEHDKAIEELERVLPLLPKLGNMPLPFDVLNSYATELAEVGKIELASEVITPVIVSPYTAFYPNWLDTEKDIREKSSRKSMVTITRSNVIYFPLREVEAPEEIEETEVEETEPSFPHANFISDVFDVRNKVESWIYESTEPNDLTTLMLAIGETDDRVEREMIIEEVIDSAFPNTPEAKEAKQRWRDGLLAKMKKEMEKPEK